MITFKLSVNSQQVLFCFPQSYQSNEGLSGKIIQSVSQSYGSESWKRHQHAIYYCKKQLTRYFMQQNYKLIQT